jgi:hypothetical protein
MMGALELMPAFGARHRHRLLAKQFVQRGQPVRMDPCEQVLARGRHPGEHRLHQVRHRWTQPILRLRSLRFRGSLRHWRLLGPGCGDRLSWSTRFSRRPGSRRYSVLKFNRDRDISTLADELGMRTLVAHCHLGLGKLYRRTGKRKQAQEHLTTPTTMYREMDMRFWLEQAEAELRQFA